MKEHLEAQLSTLEMYPVSAKKGKICKGKPRFKQLSERKRLILLIGLEDCKKVRKFEAKKNVWKIDYSDIAVEVQGDEAIDDWKEFKKETNNLFYRRVKIAPGKGVAVVEKNFRNLETRIGFLEVASLSGNIEAILIVNKRLLKKDSYLQQQYAKGLLQIGVDKVYFI